MVYASVSSREACFFHQGSWTRCDDWDLERVPDWLYFFEATMLWAVSVRLCIRFLLIQKVHDGRGRGLIFTLVQMPLGLLVWQEIWYASSRSSRTTLVHTSLQTGWMHLLLLVRSRV
eukprot:1696761-Prymnesium_polylepis.1